VVSTEERGELGVSEEPSPALADSGGAWERGWLRREADEDLPEEIVRQGAAARYHRRVNATVHSGGLLAHLDLGMEKPPRPRRGHQRVGFVQW
jgi:hypothetical protein